MDVVQIKISPLVHAHMCIYKYSIVNMGALKTGREAQGWPSVADVKNLPEEDMFQLSPRG